MRLLGLSVLVLLISGSGAQGSRAVTVYRIDHVVDGDTIALRNGQHVRLVQIDTPEVYFGTECYGPQASAVTERLLAPGTRVRLTAEIATDRLDQYRRLLRYVFRARDGLNVNLRLVAVGVFYVCSCAWHPHRSSMHTMVRKRAWLREKRR
jgi:endonuclease YncB( thermonuclease family)